MFCHLNHKNVYPGSQYGDCAIVKYSYLKYTHLGLGNYTGLGLGSVSSHPPLELPLCNLKLAPIHRGQGETEEAADHSRLVGGRFNKQENLLMRLVLGGHKVSRSPHSPARILKVYIEAFTGLSHTYRPGDLSTTLLSQG